MVPPFVPLPPQQFIEISFNPIYKSVTLKMQSSILHIGNTMLHWDSMSEVSKPQTEDTHTGINTVRNSFMESPLLYTAFKLELNKTSPEQKESYFLFGIQCTNYRVIFYASYHDLQIHHHLVT